MSLAGSRRAAALLALLLPAPSPAADAAPAAGLSSAVPSDAVFVLHARLDEAARKRMEPVWNALEASRCLEDLRARLLAGVEDEKQRKWLEREAPVWIGFLEKVAWRKLLAREILIAARADERRRQWVALFRVDPAERDGIVRSLEGVLYALGSVNPELELIHSRRENDSVTALYKRTLDPLEEAGVPPFILGTLDAAVSDGRELSVAGRGDVVLLATSGNLLQRSLQLLDGGGSDIGFAYTARRESRLAAARLVAPDGPGFEMHADPSALFPEVEALGALGACVATGKLDGGSLAYGFHAALAREARGDAGALRKALAEVPALGNVLDRVPADAAGFYAASVPKVGVLLDVVENAWKKIVPDAGGLVEDEGVRRELRELSPGGFVAQLPAGRLVYLDSRVFVQPGPGGKLGDVILALVLQGFMASRDKESRTETTASGATIMELKGKEGGTGSSYFGLREGRFVASQSSKEVVVAALEGSTSSPPPIVKGLETPAGDLVEAFDIEGAPRLAQLGMTAGALRVALRGTADPVLEAVLEASRKVTSALGQVRSPVSRARGFTVREGDAFRGQATVTFRD